MNISSLIAKYLSLINSPNDEGISLPNYLLFHPEVMLNIYLIKKLVSAFVDAKF